MSLPLNEAVERPEMTLLRVIDVDRRRRRSDATVATYRGMVPVCLEAASWMEAEGK